MADARVSHVLARHERTLMRVALQWSLCRDDALDAVQRALEIYVRRLESVDTATEIAWLKVVVKHEALAVRRQRADSVPVEEIDADDRAAAAQRPVDDVLAGRERVARSAEVLRRLKRDEAQALMLKAQGLSYREIGEALGWTYTKVNRCITEGRARFLKVYAEIETGAECSRFAPTLAALVGGTATADALLELRPHLRNCPTCRATVRRLHGARLGRLPALWPIPALAGERRLELKARLHQWWQRLPGSDMATSVQLAASAGGGGRVATIGAIIGLCLSGVGAGTVCVVTGVVRFPFGPERAHHVAARRTPEPPAPRRRHVRTIEPTQTPAPSPSPPATPHRPAGARPHRATVPAERPQARPESHEQAPASPAPAGATQDFAFEEAAPAAQTAPAQAPVNGGGEFAP